MKFKKFGWLLPLLFSLLFVFFFYNKVLVSPNSYIFTSWGDGIKNYYTYNYYIHNNLDTWNFEGLNYPYGESIFYTDGHPFLSFLIKKTEPYFPEISSYSTGIINFLMVFSLVFCSLFSYLILRHFKIPVFLSATASVTIMVLSPQLTRMLGHLALSYAFFIPITFYIFLKHVETKRYFWMIAQSVNLLFWFTIHAYLGMIATTFILTFYAIDYISRFHILKKEPSFYIEFFIMALLPIVIFNILVRVTDTHTGRTDNPWGFFATRTDFANIFLSFDRPFNYLYEWIGSSPVMRWEGRSYVGFISFVVSFIVVFHLLFRFIKRKKITLDNLFFKDRFLNLVTLSALIILLFSMAIPFRFGLEFLLDIFKFIKQFRGVGRFAWVFYYLISYLVIIYLYQNTSIKRYSQIAYLGLIMFVVFGFYEGLNQHKYLANEIVKTPNYFNQELLPNDFQQALEQIDPKEYQAILPIPFYYIGGENFGRPGNDQIYLATELLSFHTRLPVLGSHLTRNSIWEAKNINQVVGPEWYQKEIVKDFPFQKSFLIVKTPNPISSYEEDIIEKASKLISTSTFDVYSITFDSLLGTQTNDIVADFNLLSTSTESDLHKGFLTKKTTGCFFYKSFDEQKSKISFRGSGSFICKRRASTELFSFNSDSMSLDKEYIISLWVYNCGKNFGQDVLNMNISLEDKNTDGTVTKIWGYRPMESSTILGCWSMVELPFRVKESGHTYRIVLSGSKLPRQEIIVDELFIYEKEDSYFKIISKDVTRQKFLFYNNHQILLQ